MVGHRPCSVCGFELWLPVTALSVCDVGIYNDARFHGRMIVSLREHAEHFDEVSRDIATCMLDDVSIASRVLRKTLGAHRVNVAILGNQAPHVHAHVIPRYGPSEPKPDASPWDDPRPRGHAPAREMELVRKALQDAFAELSHEHVRQAVAGDRLSSATSHHSGGARADVTAASARSSSSSVTPPKPSTRPARRAVRQ